MKTIARTKLTFKNNKQWIELRSYEIEKPIQKKQSVKVVACESEDPKWCAHVNEEYMVLTWRQLKKGRILNTQTSKFPPYDTYLMYEYEFIPTESQEQLDRREDNIVTNFLQGLTERQRLELRAKLR